MSIDLDQIQARADAATEGPWDFEPIDGQFGVYSLEMQDNGEYPAVIGDPAEGGAEADAEFIAHARTDVPALLAYARDLEARLDSVRKVAASWHERYANAPIGDDRIEDALDDEAYKLEDIVNGTDFAALTATEGA